MSEPRPVLADFRFTEPLRVRWSEVDPQGIVFNPNYLVYADVAMTEYMRAVGFAYPEALLPYGADIFAVSSKVDFLDSARFDDQLTLGAKIARIGRTSFQFRIGVFRGESLLADVEMTYVCASPEARTPLPVPQPFRDKISIFEA